MSGNRRRESTDDVDLYDSIALVHIRMQRVTALGAAVSPALLGAALTRKCFLGLVLGGVGDLAQLARPSDAAPFLG